MIDLQIVEKDGLIHLQYLQKGKWITLLEMTELNAYRLGTSLVTMLQCRIFNLNDSIHIQGKTVECKTGREI